MTLGKATKREIDHTLHVYFDYSKRFMFSSIKLFNLNECKWQFPTSSNKLFCHFSALHFGSLFIKIDCNVLIYSPSKRKDVNNKMKSLILTSDNSSSQLARRGPRPVFSLTYNVGSSSGGQSTVSFTTSMTSMEKSSVEIRHILRRKKYI